MHSDPESTVTAKEWRERGPCGEKVSMGANDIPTG